MTDQERIEHIEDTHRRMWMTMHAIADYARDAIATDSKHNDAMKDILCECSNWDDTVKEDEYQ
jgi:hypothetical protein